MVDKIELPKWLMRGIEESFPFKNLDQTLAQEEAEEETKMNNIKAGNDEKKKSDKEGCCIS